MELVKSGDVVRLKYTGKFADGTVFDTSENHGPLQFIVGKGMVIPGFEEAVIDMKPGDSKTVEIPSEKAYGPHRDELILEIPKYKLPEGLEPEVGQRIQFSKENQTLELQVVAVSEANVTFDGNHPLAGKDLIFEIELLEII